MDLDALSLALEAALPGKVFETAADNGIKEYVVWQCYGNAVLNGDDTVLLEVPRVQIDIIYTRDKSLVKKVKDTLRSLSLAWETVQQGYDDTYGCMRCILQLEVA